MHYESTKDTENPLRKVKLYNRVSDGFSFRWGKKEKHSESESLPFMHKFSDAYPSGSSEFNFIIPEDSFENLDENTSSSDNRFFIQKRFVMNNKLLERQQKY